MCSVDCFYLCVHKIPYNLKTMNVMKGIFTAVTSIDSITIYGVNAAAWAASLLNISDVVKLSLG